MTNLTIARLTLKLSGLSQPERQHLSQCDSYAALRDRANSERIADRVMPRD